jgi:hypothetical protein
MSVSEQKAHFETAGEIEALVHSFESCELDPDAFKHAGHVIVALWYLHSTPEEEALERMRAGLLKLLDRHGLRDAYNETITHFWLRAVSDFLRRAGRERALTELAAELLKVYGDSRLVFSYYSRERATSDVARRVWVEPDLRALDF